jgi:hypothetical protein
MGRWLTRDPIGYAGGENLYEYCGGDPVNTVDALGLCAGGGEGFFEALSKFPSRLGRDFLKYFGVKPLTPTFGSAASANDYKELHDIVDYGQLPAEVLPKAGSQINSFIDETTGNIIIAGATQGLSSLRMAKGAAGIRSAQGKFWQGSRPGAFNTRHIFSAKHMAAGLGKLGTVADIQAAVGLRISQANCLGKLQSGPNQILTTINGQQVTIRAFFEPGGMLKNINLFIGHSTRANYGNTILL